MSLAGWLLGVAFFFPVFALGGMGAGDVKLLGALGAWLGPVAAVWVALYSGIAGGVMAAVRGAFSGYLTKAFTNVWGLLMYWRVVGLRPAPELTLSTHQGPRLAYAVPVLAGLMVTLWFREFTEAAPAFGARRRADRVRAGPPAAAARHPRPRRLRLPVPAVRGRDQRRARRRAHGGPARVRAADVQTRVCDYLRTGGVPTTTCGATGNPVVTIDMAFPIASRRARR